MSTYSPAYFTLALQKLQYRIELLNDRYNKEFLLIHQALQELANSITAQHSQQLTVRSVQVQPEIITTTDTTSIPTDSNVYSALATKNMIDANKSLLAFDPNTRLYTLVDDNDRATLLVHGLQFINSITLSVTTSGKESNINVQPVSTDAMIKGEYVYLGESYPFVLDKNNYEIYETENEYYVYNLDHSHSNVKEVCAYWYKDTGDLFICLFFDDNNDVPPEFDDVQHNGTSYYIESGAVGSTFYINPNSVKGIMPEISPKIWGVNSINDDKDSDNYQLMTEAAIKAYVNHVIDDKHGEV